MNPEQSSETVAEKKGIPQKNLFDEIITELEKYEESTPRRKSAIDSGE